MSGLQWISYDSRNTPIANGFGYNADLPRYYADIISFFNSSPPLINTGVVNALQTSNYTSPLLNNPPFTTFTQGGTEYTAIVFRGFFYATHTGNWTFTVKCDSLASDDVAMLFLGVPETPIIPNATLP